jgi:hypothetical protein
VISEKDALALADGKWKPIPRISRVIPFGYIIDPEDPNTLLPVELELRTLEEAKRHVKRFSLRDVANWITSVTGRPISHVGLKKRLEIEQSRRRKAGTLKSWARRLEEAKVKAETFDRDRLGAREAPEKAGVADT